MTKNNHQKAEKRYKFFYNPKAGRKRKLFSPNVPTLEDILDLLRRYQIAVDHEPIRDFKKTGEQVAKARQGGYKIILAAGGDGTVGAVASALVESDCTLGIIPVGSFMNNAHMLSIPNDLEKAVMTLKIGRERKIDVGKIVKLSGEKPDKPMYFLESAGIGLEAQVHKNILQLEKGDHASLLKLFKKVGEFTPTPVKIILDGKETIETKEAHVTIANGPFGGAGLHLAPEAKMNDRLLTVSIYYMSKSELIAYFMRLMQKKELKSDKIKVYQAKKVRLLTPKEYPVHADARVYGTTPAEFSIVPGGLNVICGFPEDLKKSALVNRTMLDI